MEPDKYKNIYRISSSRLQKWDYRWDAAYFITICSKNREHFFGEITNGKMTLSSIGVIADVLWYEIKTHAINIELGEFIVMPNHIHGIIILNSLRNDKPPQLEIPPIESSNVDSIKNEPKTVGEKRFQNQGKNSISSIVGSYKSAVTKHINRLGFVSEWQGRFHDHIIRDEKEFIKISNYIKNNPQLWKEDKFYSL
ncbi:MAG: transposase [Bacteroidota bacterium]